MSLPSLFLFWLSFRLSDSWFSWSFFRSIWVCFFNCRCLAEPPFPLSFRPWRRGDSHRFNRCVIIFPLTHNPNSKLQNLKSWKWAGRDSNSHDQRPPHFECGASTNFATRPWVQPSHYILFGAAATKIDRLVNLPNDQSLVPVILERDDLVEQSERISAIHPTRFY